MKISRKFLGFLGIAMLAMPGFHTPSYAATTQATTLQQSITAPICTFTNVGTGTGASSTTNCPPQAPSLDSVNVNDNRPILTGRYDSTYSRRFRVEFNNIWYELGVDPILTGNGNNWTLDLSGNNNELEAGEYPLVLEMTTSANGILTTAFILNFQLQASIPTDPTVNPISSSSTTVPSLQSTVNSVTTSIVGQPQLALSPYGTTYVTTQSLTESSATDVPELTPYHWTVQKTATIAAVVGGVTVGSFVAYGIVIRLRIF